MLTNRIFNQLNYLNMTKKLLWALLPTFLMLSIISCQKDKKPLQDDKQNIIASLLDSKKPSSPVIRTTYRAGADEGVFVNDGSTDYPDSMMHIAEGDNKTAYMPWSFWHVTEGKDKTKYFPEHVAEGENKTKFWPVWVIHVPYGPDKTKDHNFHSPSGPNKTYYVPNAPGFEHITSGANATLFRPVPDPGTWVHIVDGPQKTLYIQIKSRTGLRALPAGYQHINEGDNKSYYGRF